MLSKRTCRSPNILDCIKAKKTIVDLNITQCDKKVFYRLNGTWTSWSTWSACRKTCGAEKSTSDRYCYFNKKLLFEVPGLYNKENCEGNYTLYRDCEHFSCLFFGIYNTLCSCITAILVFLLFYFKYFKPFYGEIKKYKELLKEPKEEKNEHRVDIFVYF